MRALLAVVAMLAFAFESPVAAQVARGKVTPDLLAAHKPKNAHVFPVTVTNTPTVEAQQSGPWQVTVTNPTPAATSVTVNNTTPIPVAGSVGVSGSVSISGTPTVNVVSPNPLPVTGTVAVTATAPLPVTGTLSGSPTRFTAVTNCTEYSKPYCAANVPIPSGKLMVTEAISGLISATSLRSGPGNMCKIWTAPPDASGGSSPVATEFWVLPALVDTSTGSAYFSGSIAFNLRGRDDLTPSHSVQVICFINGSPSFFAQLVLSGYLVDE